MRAALIAMSAWAVAAVASAQPQADAVREVLAANERLESAVARGDADAIAALFDEAFRLHNAANRVLTREQVLAQFRSGATRFSDYRRTVEAAYAAGETVVLMGEERVTPEGGEPVRRRFTSVWRRTPAGWRQIARQSTNVPAS